MGSDPGLEPIAVFVLQTMTYGQATERLLETLAINTMLVESIGRAIDLDHDLAPELTVAMDGAEALSAAIQSAHAVVQAKYDNAVDRLRGEMDGGTDAG